MRAPECPSNPATPTLITADAGYHSEANLAALAAMNINALIADNDMRGRDERFADQAKHKVKTDPLHDKRGTAHGAEFPQVALTAPQRYFLAQ